MKRRYEHLLYLCIFIVTLALTTAVVVDRQNKQDVALRSTIGTEVATLEAQIASLESRITEQLGTLQEQDLLLDAQLVAINGSLQRTEQSLLGELAGVKQAGEDRSAALEDSLKTVKLQNQDFSAVIEDVIPAVVSIQTNKGSGSGFIIDTKGLIVTNAHVMEGASSGVVETSDGRRHRVRILGSNTAADVALLEINATGLKRLRFGDSDAVQIGARVIAVGNPGGLDFTVTQGIVSARRADGGNKYLQIDVPINPGNSGGPLIDAQGRVVGVNTLKRLGFEGIGFALTSNFVQEILKDLEE